MKTVVADENEVDASGPGFASRVAATVNGIGKRLRRGLAPRHATPWHAGYDAFYDAAAVNPHPAGSAAGLAWEQGRQAASEDFEW